MRDVYLLLRRIMLFVLALGIILFIAVINKEFVPYIGEKYFKEHGVEYTKIEGTLLGGVSIYNLKYADAIAIKTLSIRYSFFNLFSKTPKISLLKGDGVHVDLQQLPSSLEENSGFFVPNFFISKLQLSDIHILSQEETISFDLNSSDISHTGIDLQATRMSLALKYKEKDSNPIHFETLAKGTQVRVQNLFTLDANTSLSFALAKLSLQDTRIFVKHEKILLDLEGSDIVYKDTLDVKKISMNLESSYTHAKIKGDIIEGKFFGDGELKASSVTRTNYLDFLQAIPAVLRVKLEATPKEVLLKADLKNLALTQAEELNAKNIQLSLSYFIEGNYFQADISYLLGYLDFEAKAKQSVLFTPQGAYESTLRATLVKSSLKLPFESLSAQMQGNTEDFSCDISAGSINAFVRGEGYDTFTIEAKSKRLELSFLENFPSVVRENSIELTADARLDVFPFLLRGTIRSKGLYSKMNTSFEIDKKSALYQATIHPKPAMKKKYKMKHFLPMKVFLYDTNNSDILNLDAGLLNLTLFKTEDFIQGWGNLTSAAFTVEGNLARESGRKVSVFANIPSLGGFVSKLSPPSEEEFFYDAEANIHVDISFKEKIEVQSHIDLPWYVIKPDSQTTYTGGNVFLESSLSGNEITIERYRADFMKQNIYSKKPSKLSFNPKGEIKLEEFWVYDNLLLQGDLNPLAMEGHLRMQSKGFKYEGKDANVTLMGDISADFDANSTQKIEGNITLLEGVISYLPDSDYSINDEDIIIIQDIRPSKSANRFVNIHIDSRRPIRYKVKDIDVSITPDITLWQEPHTPLKVLGMLSIDNGELYAAGKTFELDKSEIYFYGSTPINPYLNLNLHYYTIDYTDIEIYITNTLSAPVLIFSSKPALSQNDIMSYILFGEPASSVFETPSDGSKTSVSTLLLGSGLKQIFTKTSGVQVDTLNILTNKEGTLGYEIGARFNKQIRLVYKNDTISSVILQYSLSRSIRIDVDIRETGQGVSIVYVKDFEDL